MAGIIWQETLLLPPPSPPLENPCKKVIYPVETAGTKHEFTLSSLGGAIAYHAKTLWLFSRSDVKTMIAPITVFGVANAYAASKYGIQVEDARYDSHWFLVTSLRVALWVWANLLPFTVNNQRHPEAVREDAINKPWRPMPAGRLTLDQAKWLQVALHMVALLVGSQVGGFSQCVVSIFLGAWYNNWGGSDVSFFSRNFINALGWICFMSGSLEVALGMPLPLQSKMAQWLGLIAAVVFTSVQAQDMYDQEGDSLRGRKTMPLVLGDGPARWSIAVAMAFWGWCCPWFWATPALPSLASTALAGTVAVRSLTLKTVAADQRTFLIWNIWVAFIYTMPLFSGLDP